MAKPAFWIVWNVGGGNPTVMHPDRDKAEREAQRLARLNPGADFVVFASVIGFRKTDLVRIEYDGLQQILDEEAPF